MARTTGMDPTLEVRWQPKKEKAAIIEKRKELRRRIEEDRRKCEGDPISWWDGSVPQQAPESSEGVEEKLLKSLLSEQPPGDCRQERPMLSEAAIQRLPGLLGKGEGVEDLSTTTATSEPLGARPVSPNVAGCISAIRLRGLPCDFSEQDVLAFLSQHDMVERVADVEKAVRLTGPLGQATVLVRDRLDADVVQRALHGQWLGGGHCCVEVWHEPDAVELSTAIPTTVQTLCQVLLDVTSCDV